VNRAGGTLIEALIALALGLFVINLALRTNAQLRAAQRRFDARRDAVESIRVLRHVLRRELAHQGSLAPPGPDSLPLRAYRGVAVVCGEAPIAPEYLVAYRGDRAPDPAKDSLELIYPDGTVEYAGLLSSTVSGQPCATADSTEQVLAWELAPEAVARAALVRVFERGSYHISNQALRYRRGSSGRQPLTPELWSDARSGWTVDGGRLTVTVTPSDSGAGRTWTGFLSWLRD